MDAAQAWFIAGTVPLIVAGGAHVVATLRDTRRPTFFTPIDDSVRPAMERTGIRLRQLFGGSGATPSLWRIWLGINISHGLGVATFGLVCLLIAVQDFDLVKEVDALRPLTIAFSAVYVVVSLRFWFYGPLLVTATPLVCFTIAALLSA
ncbi:MAG TPA: hypothetical protein VHF89_20325 [Solirubrobacteraceae bacterium]|nr:hypothetical protein [Solirubrobacteraceae bacterium]